jgi:ATP diphosphatase
MDMTDTAKPDRPASDLPETTPIERLKALMRRLRDPVVGCPWDKVQSFATIAPYTIEEAYEVAEAVAQNDLKSLKDELGDLLFQVVFHARMAEELGAFDLDQVAEAITDKMIRRHPHVFGPEGAADASHPVAWEAQKASERAARAGGRPLGALDGVGIALPALTRALKLQKRAARVGFDWSEIQPVVESIARELAELQAEIAAERRDPARLTDELGDVLFSVVNLARFLDVDPEAALRATNAKFERRFRHIEQRLAETGERPEQVSLDRMEDLWIEAKQKERGA